MADTSTAPEPAAAPRIRRLTFEEFVAAAEAGAFGRNARVELIAGDIVDIPPQSPEHYRLKNALGAHFIRRAPEDLKVFIEGTLKLGPTTGVDPDVTIVSGDRGGEIDPRNAILVAEIAVSSLDYDLARKAQLYARAGVQEYWVLDVASAMTFVHAARTGEGWSEPVAVPFDQAIAPKGAPLLTVRIADLKL